MGSNCGYHIVYSGTVAGAREAFFNGVPAVSVSYKWNKTCPHNCFLSIDVPTNVLNHKGYLLTKQGKSALQVVWRQVTSDASFSSKHEHLWFTREITGSPVDDGDTDYGSLVEGYITVTPLRALSPAESDSHIYFEQWLPRVV